MKPLAERATMPAHRLPHFATVQPVRVDPETGAYTPDAWLGGDQAFAAACVNEQKWQVTDFAPLANRDPDFTHRITLWGSDGRWHALARACSHSENSARILADIYAEHSIAFCFNALAGREWEYEDDAPHGLAHEARSNCLRYLSVYELDGGRVAIGFNHGTSSQPLRRLSPLAQYELSGARLVRRVDLTTNTERTFAPARDHADD